MSLYAKSLEGCGYGDIIHQFDMRCNTQKFCIKNSRGIILNTPTAYHYIKAQS